MNSQPVRRVCLTVAYDGTAYAGWQIQPHGTTVQALIEAAIRSVTGLDVKIHGSGRTDQGVHARGQVVHVDLEHPIRHGDLLRALNAVLPQDIRILRSSQVSPEFHARRSAVGKEYRYFIWNGDVVPPFVRLYRAQVRRPLDVAAMREAAHILCGRHDFGAFTANPSRVVESTVRHVTRLSVTRRGPEVVIRAEADGFLYKMVRSLAGWLIRVGEGAVEPGRTREILDSRERTARVPTAPPEGLFLWRVWYKKP